MNEDIEILKMRILMCFIKMSSESCTVTNLAKILVKEKYSVSRAMIALEKGGFLDRSDTRHPKLTPLGIDRGKSYIDRTNIVINYLIYEGLSEDKAYDDGFQIALNCSKSTIDMMKCIEAKHRSKKYLSERKFFDGSVLCRKLSDGIYKIPYTIYTSKISESNDIAIDNYFFENPCQLIVSNGVGVIRLRAISSSYALPSKAIKVFGKVMGLKYCDGDSFLDSEHTGDFYKIPAEALKFINIGEGSLLQGRVCIKTKLNAKDMQEIESTSIFNMIFN